jgi:hypothetical protein
MCFFWVGLIDFKTAIINIINFNFKNYENFKKLDIQVVASGFIESLSYLIRYFVGDISLQLSSRNSMALVGAVYINGNIFFR